MTGDISETTVPEIAASAGVDIRRVCSNPDFWYPVAWSRELRRGKAIGVRYAGQPIVVVRPDAGAIFALDDVCPHRQLPLSRGEVCGDFVRCAYHGLKYSRRGQCFSPDMKLENEPPRLRTWPCREKDGLIFVFMGNLEKSDSVPLPDFPRVRDPQYRTRRFGKVVQCHYSFMHENLMDMNHQVLHSRLVGSMKPRFLGMVRAKDFVEARYTFARTGGKQPLSEALIYGQRRKDGRDFAYRDVMTIRTQYPYQTLRIETQGVDEPVMELWIAYVPQDREELSNRVFGLLSIRRLKIPFVLDLAWPLLIAFTERVFTEDREIVELEQQAWREQDGDRNQEVFPVIVALRQILIQNGMSPRKDVRE